MVAGGPVNKVCLGSQLAQGQVFEVFPEWPEAVIICRGGSLPLMPLKQSHSRGLTNPGHRRGQGMGGGAPDLAMGFQAGPGILFPGAHCWIRAFVRRSLTAAHG